eukprot:4690610-Alexandrium_andersonii.AAC.1
MASIRCADLARRHGQCGTGRFWFPYRGGCSVDTASTPSMAMPPGRQVPVMQYGRRYGHFGTE